MFAPIILVVAVVSAAVHAGQATFPTRPPFSTIEPSLSQIIAAQATQSALSLVSNVKGVAFDRIAHIWLENIVRASILQLTTKSILTDESFEDYDKAAGDPNIQSLAAQGITLDNFYAISHPSESNYCGVVAGDNFGMDNDDFNRIPSNISTIVDLLDTKGISWGEYQEDIPYPGYQGFNYSNQVSFANDYVRKHNPLVLFDSVTSNTTRLSLIKNFTLFYSDLASQILPQWFFITPNMTNDGHDTTITFAANWARSFITPLLNNTYFMNNALIVLTFDESETYTIGNKVFTLLLGGAIPTSAKGTKIALFIPTIACFPLFR
jgi:acid phosphatase